MLGIHPRVVVHKLSLNPASRPIKQNKRNFAPEHNQAIAKEVEKLLAVGFIKRFTVPTDYPIW